jgi:hypothetical protein
LFFLGVLGCLPPPPPPLRALYEPGSAAKMPPGLCTEQAGGAL